MEDHDVKDLRGRIEKALTLVESRQDNISALQHEEEQKYLAARKQHRRKMRAWKQQLDALEDQHEQLTLGAGAASRGRAPRNLDQLSGILEEVLQTGAEKRNGAVAGRKAPVNPLEGRLRSPANGRARSEDSDDEYISPSEDDMDEDGYDEEDEDDEERPAPAPKAPQMVPRQVAVRQQRPSGPAPPGFESQGADRPNATVPPPGFEGKAALQTSPGIPRSSNGFPKTSPAKESRGAADMKPTDLRSLLSRRREGSSPQLSHTPRTDNSDGDPPAPAVPDAREIINMRKRDPQEPPAPRPMREWDAGKEALQDDAPAERPARPVRPGVPLYQPLYQPRPRDRAPDAATPLPPPPTLPPPPPGFAAGPERPQPISAARAPSGVSDDGFKAPSSPMVDPEEGSRDRAYFSNGQAQSEDASSSTLQDQLFPSLGTASKGVDAEGGSPSSAALGPQLKGAWGSGSIASRLAQVQKDPATVSSPAPGSVDMVAYEQRAGLRPKHDTTPDKERRQQMRSKKDFVHEEDVRTGRQRGWANVVEGLELHKNLLSPAEQEIFIQAIKDWEAQGRQNELRGRTFSAPRKSMRGKGRVTIQFGCCYNYAVDREGRQPGIIPEEVVEPMPDLLVALVKRLVRWGVLPAKMAPDTAIINIYDQIDCIPPHIDHHDFSRPFCTISLLSEQAIMFGHKLVPLSAGNFVGATCEPFLLPLPVGSCLVLKGNGADVAMHCVPPVSEKRMSITLRRMGPQYADQVRKQAERAAQQVQRLPRSWADDAVEEAPRRYGADDWEEAEGNNDNRLQRF